MWDTGKKIDELWAKLPRFVRGHQTIRTTITSESGDYNEFGPEKEEPIHKANLITSKFVTAFGTEYHAPVLDIDFEAELIPSSTEGHYHLFLDRAMSKELYFELLDVLARVGILQYGFVEGAKKRGASSVRLPWIKKDDWHANQADPDLKIKNLEARLSYHEKLVKKTRAELDSIVTF